MDGGDLERRSSGLGEVEGEADLGWSPFPFSIGEQDRLRDFLTSDFSLEGLRESRSDLGFDTLLERDFLFDLDLDFLLGEWEWDFLVRDLERDFLVRDLDRDLLAGDLERDFLADLERRLLLERDLK